MNCPYCGKKAMEYIRHRGYDTTTGEPVPYKYFVCPVLKPLWVRVLYLFGWRKHLFKVKDWRYY